MVSSCRPKLTRGENSDADKVEEKVPQPEERFQAAEKVLEGDPKVKD